MSKFAQIALFCTVLLLSACAAAKPVPRPEPLPPLPTKATLNFQFDQSVTIEFDRKLDPALQTAFEHWVYQGVYIQAPVYRQYPGVFLLTGKPRLAGNGFVYGTMPTPKPNGKAPPSAKTGEVGIVVHADGTVGPELIIYYGRGIVACCGEPQNIRIGSITSGRRTLKTVQRGDNLTNIAIQP